MGIRRPPVHVIFTLLVFASTGRMPGRPKTRARASGNKSSHTIFGWIPARAAAHDREPIRKNVGCNPVLTTVRARSDSGQTEKRNGGITKTSGSSRRGRWNRSHSADRDAVGHRQRERRGLHDDAGVVRHPVDGNGFS